MQETWIRSLVQKDPLEKGMVTHYSFLAWRIPQRSVVGSQSIGRKESDTTERLILFTLYQNLTVTANRKSTIDIHTKKKNESEHKTKVSQQTTRGKNKWERGKKDQQKQIQNN